MFSHAIENAHINDSKMLRSTNIPRFYFMQVKRVSLGLASYRI